MSIAETYKERILTELIKDFLQEGIIPTADQLIEAYNSEVEGHADMTRPFIIDEEHQVTANEESSADANNELFERLQLDLETLYQDIWINMSDGMESFDRWRLELEATKNELEDLESRIDALLILRIDTAGYYAFVEDNFINMNKVDFANTTARVDAVNHIVSINEDVADITSLQMNTIDAKQASFAVLTRENMLSAIAAPGTEVRNAVQDVSTHWQHRVRFLTADQPVSGELKIQLGDSSVDVSSIEMQLHQSNNNSAVIIMGQYSNDNYNWFNLPTNTYVQSTDDRAVFVFPTTSMKWIKFVLTKNGPDSVDGNQFVYEFGASSIKFFETPGYDTTSGITFVSNTLSTTDNDGNNVDFSRVALRTCEEIPEDTEIKYWVKASDGTDETEYMRIDPFTRDNPVATTLIDFGKTLESETSDLFIVNKTASDSLDFFGAYINFIESDKLAVIGTSSTSALQISAGTFATYIDTTIALYKNTGPQYGTSDIVRDNIRGWTLDATETYYETKVVIFHDEGLPIDLGGTNAIINGKLVSGKTIIPKGVNTFKTLKNNFAVLSSFDEFDTEAELIAADSLWPYNHKAIVEGVQYAFDYNGNKPYIGADIFCEYVCQRVSMFDLMHNVADDDYSKYAIDTDPAGNYIIVVRFNPTDTNYGNETHEFRTKTKNSMFNEIILKAELSSTVSNKTPQLTAYRIMLGS